MENKEITAREIARKVSDKLNTFGNKNAIEFISVILNDHPTLQQKFMGEIVIRFIHEVAKRNENRFDGRNRMTYELCKKLNQVLCEVGAEEGLPLI